MKKNVSSVLLVVLIAVLLFSFLTQFFGFFDYTVTERVVVDQIAVEVEVEPEYIDGEYVEVEPEIVMTNVYETQTFERTISLARYVWFPLDYGVVTNHINEQLPYRFTVNDIVTAAVLFPFLAVLLIIWLLVFMLKKMRGKIVAAVIILSWGLWAVMEFLTNQALRLGGSAYTLSFVAYIAVVVVALALFIAELSGILAKKEKNV